MESIGETGLVLSGQMVMILHFLGLRFMLFCWAHCEMQLMLFCRDDASPKLVTSDIVTCTAKVCFSQVVFVIL